MKNKNKLMAILIALLGACSSDNNTQDNSDMSNNDADAVKDIVENDVNDADAGSDAADQKNLKVCEALPPEFIFEPETNLEEVLGCEISMSPIQFVEYDETKITGLDSLRELRGPAGLIIRRAPNLVDVDTFANLEFVTNDILISDVPTLADLTGFRSLRRVEGPLTLEFFALKNFNGLQNLEYVGEFDLDVYQLESLEGLENLTEVKGDFSLYAPTITENQFREFLQGKTIGGDIRFQDRIFTP